MDAVHPRCLEEGHDAHHHSYVRHIHRIRHICRIHCTHHIPRTRRIHADHLRLRAHPLVRAPERCAARDRAADASGGGAAGAGAAAALLDAAAVSTVRRRAALRPAPAGERPAPAPADPRPLLPPAARRRLSLLLADRGGNGGGGGGGGGSRRGTAPDLTELLPQWLTAAVEHGYRAPEALLPALLDAARARTDLRPAALALAGPRALWLAGLNDAWKFALRGTGSGTGLPGDGEPAAVRRTWEEGLFAERVALLTALRRHDPCGRSGAADHDLVHGAGRGPPDVPRLAAREPLDGR